MSTFVYQGMLAAIITRSTTPPAPGSPGPCRVAASMGGPCGCWAAHVLLDRLDHVWHGINLWLANDWLRFPHVAAAPGTAAVWPGRHVAPVIAVNGDRTVTVRDSWATHKVRMAGLGIRPATDAAASQADLHGRRECHSKSGGAHALSR